MSGHWRTGELFRTVDALTRLLEKVEIVPWSGCWIYMGALSTKGYGRFGWRGTITNAQRASWELRNGVILPRNLDACHSCDVTCCVNPSHIWIGDRKANMQDCKNKGRSSKPPRTKPRTHCKRGHPMTEGNLYIMPCDGTRRCLACKKFRDAARSEKS